MSHIDIHVLGPATEVAEGDVVPYYLEDEKRRVSVARIDGTPYAFDDLCTHGGCPLSAGLLEGFVLLCQCHGCEFDVRTGAVLHGPATVALAVHDVREEEGQIRVTLAAG